MTALRFTAILLATSFALVAERVFAQARTSAAIDATVGIGAGKGGEYFDRAIGGGRLAASLRRWQTPRTGVFGELSMDWLAVSIAGPAHLVADAKLAVAPEAVEEPLQLR